VACHGSAGAKSLLPGVLAERLPAEVRLQPEALGVALVELGDASCASCSESKLPARSESSLLR
jgi:hypothetical protein